MVHKEDVYGSIGASMVLVEDIFGHTNHVHMKNTKQTD